MPAMIARLVMTAIGAVAGFFGYEVVTDDDDAVLQGMTTAITAVLTLASMIALRPKPSGGAGKRSSVLIVLLLAMAAIGCGDTPPLVDAEQVQRNVDTLTETVNAVALEAAELRPGVDLVCGFDARACATLEGGYGAIEDAVDEAHRLIGKYAEQGAGLLSARAAVRALELAIGKLQEHVVAAVEEAKHAVMGDMGSRGRGSAATEAPAEPAGASGQAEGADHGGAGGAPEPPPGADAREVGEAAGGQAR